MCTSFLYLSLLENEKEIGEYIVHSVIGSGHSSTVYCCLRNHQGLKEAESGAKNYVRNGNMVALKTLEKKKVVSLEDLFKVEREVEALSLLSPHQNIVRYYHTLHGSQRIYILMECYPSDLVSVAFISATDLVSACYCFVASSLSNICYVPPPSLQHLLMFTH